MCFINSRILLLCNRYFLSFAHTRLICISNRYCNMLIIYHFLSLNNSSRLLQNLFMLGKHTHGAGKKPHSIFILKYVQFSDFKCDPINPIYKFWFVKKKTSLVILIVLKSGSLWCIINCSLITSYNVHLIKNHWSI